MEKINRCSHCMNETSPGAAFCRYCGKPIVDTDVPQYCLKPMSILHGKYLVGSMLGQGGFGITYIGYDLTLDVKVAIKEYFPMNQATRYNGTSNRVTWNGTRETGAPNRDGCDSFLREARKMARVRNIPQVVSVQETFEENETAYIVMDYVEGITLREKVEREGPLGFEETYRLLRPVIAALGSVHRQHIIHRDISPDNIMIQPDGQARILDLGAAKEITSSGGMTSQLVAKGGFSPYEQYMSTGESGTWTDVYAMCATIYWCSCGSRVPDAPDRVDLDGLKFPPGAFPGQVETALRKGLAVRRGNRVQTMEELLRGLDDALSAGSDQRRAAPAGGESYGSSYRPNQPNQPGQEPTYAGQNYGSAYRQPGYDASQGYNPSFNPNQGYNQSFNPNQGYNQSYNPNQGYAPGYDAGQGYNPSYNPNPAYDQGAAAGYAPPPKQPAPAKKKKAKSNKSKTKTVTVLVAVGALVVIAALVLILVLPKGEEITLGGKTFSSDVTELDLSNCGITDISALASCTELRTLDLSGNRITDLTPLAGLVNMETLHLDSNDISNIRALEDMTKLTTLTLSGNNFNNVVIYNFPSLKTLDLSDSGVNTLTLYSLPELRSLDVTNTNLTPFQVASIRSQFPDCDINSDT